MDTELLRIFEVGKSYTIQEIMKLTGKSYKPVYFSLMKLCRDGYLLRRRKGWKHCFRLNLSNPVSRKWAELVLVERRERFLREMDEERRRSLEEVMEEILEKVPVLSVLLDESNGKLLFVVPERNGYGAVIRKLCRKNGNGFFSSRTKSLRAFRRLLMKGDVDGIVLFGMEFWIREKVRAMVNINGNGNERNGRNRNGRNWNGLNGLNGANKNRYWR